MHSNLNYLLVTATCFLGICEAIRVEWNTNTGPIIPPTPTTTIRPVPPFREPAPVWEDLSNDLPDPNPYIYVPPPPSRPKQRLHTNVNYNSNDGSSGKPHGTIVTSQNSNNFYPQYNNNNSPQVASLSPQYIPNVGTRYVAVVPTSYPGKHAQTASSNALPPGDKTNSYKLQGKYNLKTKKYKAYEKAKYAPLNYYASSSSSNVTTAVQTPQPEAVPELSQFHYNATTATPKRDYSPSKSYTKHVYAKDKTTSKPKGKPNNFKDETKKS